MNSCCKSTYFILASSILITCILSLRCGIQPSSTETQQSDFEEILSDIDKKLDRQDISAVPALLDSAKQLLATSSDTTRSSDVLKAHIQLAIRECFYLVEEERSQEFLQLWNNTGRQLARYEANSAALRARHQAVKAWYFARTQLDSAIFYCDSAERVLQNSAQPDQQLLPRLYQTRAIAYYVGALPIESIRATDIGLMHATQTDPAQTDSVLWGTLYNLRAALHFGFQEFEEAIYWLEKYRRTQPNTPSFEARYLGNLAAVYYVQHQFDRAIALNRRAINIRKDKEDKGTLTRLAENYGNQGQFFVTIEELDSAAHYLELTLHIREKEIERRDITIASTQYALGNVRMKQGKMEEADSLLLAATRLFKKSLPPYSNMLGDYYNIYSTFFELSGNTREALEQRQNGLRVALKEPEKLAGMDNPALDDILLPDQALSNLTAKAQLQYSLYNPGLDKELNAALETAEIALRLSKQIRNDIHAKRFHWAMGQYLEPLYQLLVKGYIERHKQQNSTADLTAAYNVVQTGKSEMLRRMRRESNAFEHISIPDSQRIHITSLQKRLWRIDSMINQMASDPQNSHFTALQDSMIYLSGRHTAALNDLAASSDRFRILYADSTEVRLTDIHESLRKKEQNLLDLFIVDNTLYMFAVSPDTLILNTVLIDSAFNANLERLQQSTRLPVNDFNSYSIAARYIYTKAIEPIRPFLNGKSLLISPDQQLHKLPFEALLSADPDQPVSESYNGLPFLGLEMDIQYTYSYTFTRLKESSDDSLSANNNFIGFAPGFQDYTISDTLNHVLLPYYSEDEQVSIPPLPYSHLEVKRIEERFLRHKEFNLPLLAQFIYPEVQSLTGSKASESNLYSQDFSNTQYIHFTTHGLYDPKNPAKTAILLQSDAHNNGVVMSSDIYSLDLNAELVVLNACESALGYWSAGEGMVSPAQAFLVAGAKNVLVALWKTENRSTAFFFDHFYEALLSGKSHIKALKEAQKACLKSEDFRHPFYWAGFILIG